MVLAKVYGLLRYEPLYFGIPVPTFLRRLLTTSLGSAVL